MALIESGGLLSVSRRSRADCNSIIRSIS